MAAEEEEEGLGVRVEVWVEEIGRKNCTSKSKGIMAMLVLKAISGAYMREGDVKMHIADHWNSTGTWRKLSI